MDVGYRTDRRVALSRVEDYDEAVVERVLREQMNALGIGRKDFEGRRVVLKPNLVVRRKPLQAATTHPVVVQAVVRIIREWDPKQILIAESPASTYTPQSLESAYKASGFYELAREEGAEFNFDTQDETVAAPDGRICREFQLIRPICEADIIVNLCKLKTHSLAKMTAGVKNFFGTIPGRDKVEMHARFSRTPDFCSMLTDLCDCICSRVPVCTICDGILAMEGEGPGTGDPRWMHALLSGMNPFALDLACCELIGYGNTVPIVEESKKRGLCPRQASELEVIGTAISELAVTDFKEPRSQALATGIHLIPGFLKPHPVIDRDVCRGCGMCAESCPRHTIRLEDGKARIHRKDCIRCFCCQEVCPFKAVRIKRSVLFEKVLH